MMDLETENENENAVYVAYYDLPQYSHENRLASLAPIPVVEYISSVLGEIFNEVKIFSPTRTMNKKGFIKKRTNDIGRNIRLYHPSTFGTRGRSGRLLSLLYAQLWLFFKLLGMHKNDTLIVYHNLACINVIKLIKKLKKVRLAIEVRELYADVLCDSKIKNKEFSFFKYADSFIFASGELNKLINTDNKPYVVGHAGYSVCESKGNSLFGDPKDTIHCVYAGTFSMLKGSLSFIESAKYLDSHYHLHIIGFGSKEHTEAVQNKVAEISKITACKVSYDGCLRGIEFDAYLESCHIGICPQAPSAEYTETSFPSKIITYLSHGLRVVSIRIGPLENSYIKDNIVFFDEQTPLEIAKALKSVDLSASSSSKEVIQSLDVEFRKGIQRVLLD